MENINANTTITTTVFRSSLERAPNALSAEEYERKFLEVVTESFKLFRSDNTPLPQELFDDPDKAKRYFGIYRMLHSFFAKMFPSFLLNVASRCPYQDVRREILKDCWDEEVSDPDANGMCHIEVLHHDAEQLGVSREEVESFEPTPIIMSCTHALDNLSRTLPWEGGYAAIGGLEVARLAVRRGYLSEAELGFGVAPSRQMEDLCKLPKGSLLGGPLHAQKDVIHGGDTLRVLKKYATSRETQELTFWAVKTSRSMRTITHREQRRLALAAIGLPSDNLVVT